MARVPNPTEADRLLGPEPHTRTPRPDHPAGAFAFTVNAQPSPVKTTW